MVYHTHQRGRTSPIPARFVFLQPNRKLEIELTLNRAQVKRNADIPLNSMHRTVKKLWREYLNTLDQNDPESKSVIPAWHFCDNKKDADECARLVLSGKKRATSPSVWELKLNNEKIPEVSDIKLITNWDGIAQCVIRTVAVEIVPFNKVTSKHAALEGEGDGSLTYWRKVHQAYYERMLKDSDYEFQKDMPIVCEQFEVVYPST